MGVPFRRTSKTRKAKRRTHQRAKNPTVTICNNCGAKITPHTVCKNCGYYNGKKILDVNDDKE